MSSPRAVSVVIPSYNHARFIGEAVGSALGEGGDELEVVVVDDGSTDDTLACLRALDAGPRLRVLTQENLGAHAALNRGVLEARGELVFVLDSDDAYVPGRVEALRNVLDETPGAVVAASWIEIVDEAGGTLGSKHGWHDLPPWPRPEPGPGLADLDDPVLALLESNWVSTTSNFAFRRSLVAEHGLRFLPLRYAHDWDFLLAATRLGDLAVVEEPLVRYRVHGTNTIAEGREEAAGRARMRFEILWLVARHYRRVVERGVASGWSRCELEERASRSLPRFGEAALLSELLFLRGCGDEVPEAYDRLFESGHPFAEASLGALS
jgi:glycosyltransferase involved in cell wall biosynthesis